MKIAIDCRYNQSGIGRVLFGILSNLPQGNEYYLIGQENKLPRRADFHYLANDSSPFSIKGILKINTEINKQCDCLFVPNFIIPFNVRIPVYTICHDFLFLDEKYANKNLADRLLKKYLFRRCFKKSKHIFCVSEFTKKRAEHYFPQAAFKTSYSHIGISPKALDFRYEGVQKKKQIIFVGNLKKNKGLDTLLKCSKDLHDSGFDILIVGEKEGLKTSEDFSSFDLSYVTFTGKIFSDDDLYAKIAESYFLVQPSRYEGFGIPPLEALCVNTKPIVSDIAVFEEIDKPLDVAFFKVGDFENLKKTILTADPFIDCKSQRVKIKELYSYKNFADTLFAEITKNEKESK
jgi:glycosyltransferase involved in cell wall biosynthesis